MSGSNSNDIMRAWAYWHQPLSLPHLQLPPQVMAPQGPLPGQGIFAGLAPEQQFWLQHLMGQGVGGEAPPGNVNPYYLMMLMQGPQSAVYSPQEEGQQE